MNAIEIKAICQQYGLTPSKSKGQNFLIDENIVAKIVDSANLDKKETVLEVGPGLGVLTAKLAQTAGRVVAVELDKKAIDYLQVAFLGVKNLEIVQNDILKLNLASLDLKNGDFKIVANLPYNITSYFLRLFLENSLIKPKEMILMVQKEVAERLTAQPGEMSVLSLVAQFFSQPEILFLVSKNSFWPVPAVDSAVIRLKIKEKLPNLDKKKLIQVIKFGFAARRKQLHNNLSAGLKISNDQAKDILRALGFDEKIRAQDLALADWQKIIAKLS